MFCLTVPENIVGESFCVSELFCYGIIVWIRGLGGAGVSQFSVRNILWHSGEKCSQRNPSVFHNFRYPKTLCIKVVYHEFCGNIFVPHDQKLRVGAFLFLRTFLLSESFLDKMVGPCIAIFRQEFLSHIAERKRTGVFVCSTDFGCQKIFA